MCCCLNSPNCCLVESCSHAWLFNHYLSVCLAVWSALWCDASLGLLITASLRSLKLLRSVFLFINCLVFPLSFDSAVITASRLTTLLLFRQILQQRSDNLSSSEPAPDSEAKLPRQKVLPTYKTTFSPVKSACLIVRPDIPLAERCLNPSQKPSWWSRSRCSL